MRYLAIDLGERRTGLAVGDDETGIATPLEVIVTRGEGERLRRIGRAIGEHHPDALVVGLPLNMDSSSGPGVERAKRFAAELEKECALRVHLVDERLSSAAAEEQMSRSSLTHKKKKQWRDALAAAAILRGFLESRRRGDPG